MSVFTIHSIGDSAFLEQILTAVSMIVGTGDFERMVSVGLLLGIFMICVQALFQGGKRIDFQQILVGWILYACFFLSCRPLGRSAVRVLAFVFPDVVCRQVLRGPAVVSVDKMKRA